MFFSVFQISVIGYRHVVFGSRITDIGCKGTKKKLYVQEIRRKKCIFIYTLFEKWYK